MNSERSGAIERGAAGTPLSEPTKYDALVVGSGIGGMESALKLGDMGYKVPPASAAR